MAYADIAGITVERRPGMGGPRSEVTQGPQRWERARLNAERNPHSPAAALYRGRRATARNIVEQLGEIRSDKAFVTVEDKSYRVGHHAPTKRRYFCSIECLAMDMQLGRFDGAQILDAVDRVKLHGRVVLNERPPHYSLYLNLIDRATQRYAVKCRTCHAQIAGDRAQVAAIAKATEAVKQYVLVNGEFVPLSQLRVVDLTDHERDLLAKYSTPHLRDRFVTDKGRRFDA